MTASQHTILLAALLAVFVEMSPAQDDQTLDQAMNEYETLNSRIASYSHQKIVALDVDEEDAFTLHSGAQRTIRLVGVKEYCDQVIQRVRRAEIDVLVNGKPVRLACAPYVMPAEVDGLRIQADTTSAWVQLPKRVQFSIWDATDPIVNTDRFGFPLPDYRLFSHGIQCYNEVVHLGRRDGDPGGQTFYHNYGIDFAGYEGRNEVVSCLDGTVVGVWENPENPFSVVLQDEAGLLWEYGHFDSILPQVRKGARIRKGQKLGILGKTGPSGDFSHLHVGTYLSKDHFDADNANRRLNLYPWMVAAYQAQHPRDLYAVARPHHLALTGEKVLFDGSNSLAFGGKIASYRWEFHDGQVVEGVRAEKVFNGPGTYIATLRVRDEKAREDVDFCKVKVFTRSAPELAIPTIFMTYIPTEGIAVNQPVSFRFWLQTGNDETMTVGFGDGTVVNQYASYSELTHGFKTPGIHIVAARATVAGDPITQKLKVLVYPNDERKPARPDEGENQEPRRR
jgi:murein DD-endopeptidase MepM/ murein hydrolase activator NlpD